ncbi:hypothetical protein GGX14DRAFT_355273, partial [Mycena pura]
YETAKTLLVHVLEKQRQIMGVDHPETLDSMGNLAYTYNQLGQFENALELGSLVTTKSKQTLGEDHPDTVSFMNNLGVVYDRLGRIHW